MTDQPINLSYSAIDTFLRCPRKYEWQYITKIPTRTNAFLLLGGAYHKAIGKGFEYKREKGVFLPTDEACDIFGQTWDNKDEIEDEEVKAMEIDWANENPGQMKDDGYNLVKMYAVEQAPKIEPLEVELKVERDYAFGKFRGRIDLIPDKPKPKKGLQLQKPEPDLPPTHPPLLRIIEHKTAKRKKDQTEVNTSLQSYSYGYALGQPTEMEWHVAVRKKVPEVQTDLKVTRTMDHIKWFEKEVLEPVAKAIQSGIYYPCPSKISCWGCAYQAIGLCNPYMEME